VSTARSDLYGYGMDAAVSSLLGVVAGGFITYGTQRGLGSRLMRRDRSSARAMLELADLGFSTLEDDDPLIVMIQNEASKAD
jgi:hypothetical protein